jgi:hypothetical protein
MVSGGKIGGLGGKVADAPDPAILRHWHAFPQRTMFLVESSPFTNFAVDSEVVP